MTYYNISIDKIRSKYIYKNIYSQKTKSVLYKKLSKYVFEDEQTTYNCILLIVMEKILQDRFMIVNIKDPTKYGTEIIIRPLLNVRDFYTTIQIINTYVKKINKKNQSEFWLYKIKYE